MTHDVLRGSLGCDVHMDWRNAKLEARSLQEGVIEKSLVCQARKLTPVLSGNEEHGGCRVGEKHPSHEKRGAPLIHRNFQNQGSSATTTCPHPSHPVPASLCTLAPPSLTGHWHFVCDAGSF